MLRLKCAASTYRESLHLGIRRCEKSRLLLTQRQAAAAQEVAEGPATDANEEIGDDGAGGAVSEASSGLEWAAVACDAEDRRVDAAKMTEKARCSETVAQLEEQRAAVKKGAETGDKVLYLAAQEVQHRGLARDLEADAATLLPRSLQATAQADAANCRRLSLVQARETRKVAVLLVVDAAEERLAELEAIEQAFGTAWSLLEAAEGRAEWLGGVFVARLKFFEVVLAEHEAEFLFL